jgi:2-isopropylmalate synthase
MTAVSDTAEKIRAVFGSRSGSLISKSGVVIEDSTALSKESSASDIAQAVKTLGYDLSEEDNAHVYDEFRKVAENKAVSLRELDAIVAAAALQVPSAYKLKSYVINSGNVINATANIELTCGDKVLSGISTGDGPVDAAFRAIEQITGHHYDVDDFQIQSLTEGREAVGSSVVKLRSESGKLYPGKGVSTDIIGAAIKAYISSLNKIYHSEM